MPLRLDALAPDEMMGTDAADAPSAGRSRPAPNPNRTKCVAFVLAGLLTPEQAGGAFGVAAWTVRRWILELRAEDAADPATARDAIRLILDNPVLPGRARKSS